MSKSRKFYNVPCQLVVMSDVFVNDKDEEIAYIKAHIEINGLKFYLDTKADYNLRKTLQNAIKENE